MGIIILYKLIWWNVILSLLLERVKLCVVGIGIFWYFIMVFFIFKKKEKNNELLLNLVKFIRFLVF